MCIYMYSTVARGGTTGAVQLKQLATDYSQQKHTTWAGRGRIIIAQSKANCLSCTAPVVPPLYGSSIAIHVAVRTNNVLSVINSPHIHCVIPKLTPQCVPL